MSVYEPSHHDLNRFAYYLSASGVTIAVFGILISIIAAIFDHGANIFQMRIDSLGDYLTSPLAYVFNISLLLDGVFFAFAMGGLLKQHHSANANLLAIFGAITALGLVIAGLYPYNEIYPHQIGEIIYLTGSLLVFSMLIFSFFNCRTLCGPKTFILSILGLICASLMLLHVDGHTLDYTRCIDIIAPCFLFPLTWLHSTFAILVALSMAATVLKLGLADPASQLHLA